MLGFLRHPNLPRYTLLSQSFISVTAANAFFNDQFIDLGAWAPLPIGSGLIDLKISLSVTSNTYGDGYGIDFMLGDPPPALPEPSTLALFSLGGLIFSRRTLRNHKLQSPTRKPDEI